RLVRPDSMYERPIPERHRLVFYLGHLEAFDWNLIARYALDRRAFHPEFDRLFAFGIDPPPGQLPNDQPSDWPRLEEIEGYNRRVRQELDELWGEVPEQLLHVALEHRQMHAETFAYLMHALPYDRKVPQGVDGGRPGPEPKSQMIWVPAGHAEMGQREAGEFGWDNEFQPCRIETGEFGISKYKVTNGEYLEFVRAGAARA